MTILRSHMPQNWIIRETTERDYGVDLYVELVGPENLLSGNLVALQLKAKNTFKFKNGHSVLSGIKRETLNYWLSLPVPVFLVAACLSTKEIFWSNIRQQDREGQFQGDSKSVSVKLFSGRNCSHPGVIMFWRSYFREKRWSKIENAIEMSLMLFNSFGPLVLMCERAQDKTPCTTTVQYLINQHYEYYTLMFRYLLGGTPRPLPDWYSENLEYIRSTGQEPLVTMYHHTLKAMLRSFIVDYRKCIVRAYRLVTDRQANYFSKQFPYLYMHLKDRPHTFVEEDWLARFYFDEYEDETRHPEQLYFAEFGVYFGDLADIKPS
jgi:Domain of unknown function (DUF4365)